MCLGSSRSVGAPTEDVFKKYFKNPILCKKKKKKQDVINPAMGVNWGYLWGHARVAGGWLS